MFQTAADHLIFYKVEFCTSTSLYDAKDVDPAKARARNSLELVVKDPIPKVQLVPGAVVHLSNKGTWYPLPFLLTVVYSFYN